MWSQPHKTCSTRSLTANNYRLIHACFFCNTNRRKPAFLKYLLIEILVGFHNFSFSQTPDCYTDFYDQIVLPVGNISAHLCKSKFWNHYGMAIWKRTFSNKRKLVLGMFINRLVTFRASLGTFCVKTVWLINCRFFTVWAWRVRHCCDLS